MADGYLDVLVGAGTVRMPSSYLGRASVPDYHGMLDDSIASHVEISKDYCYVVASGHADSNGSSDGAKGRTLSERVGLRQDSMVQAKESPQYQFDAEICTNTSLNTLGSELRAYYRRLRYKRKSAVAAINRPAGGAHAAYVSAATAAKSYVEDVGEFQGTHGSVEESSSATSAWDTSSELAALQHRTEAMQAIASQWRSAFSPSGRLYYYRHADRVPYWEPPAGVDPRLIPCRGTYSSELRGHPDSDQFAGSARDAKEQHYPVSVAARPPSSTPATVPVVDRRGVGMQQHGRKPSGAARQSHGSAGAMFGDDSYPIGTDTKPVSPTTASGEHAGSPLEGPAHGRSAVQPRLAAEQCDISSGSTSVIAAFKHLYALAPKDHSGRKDGAVSNSRELGLESASLGEQSATGADVSAAAHTSGPSEDRSKPANSQPAPSRRPRTNVKQAGHRKRSIRTPRDAVPDPHTCKHCGRHFAEGRLDKHESVCESVFIRKRAVFESAPRRIQHTPAEKFVQVPDCPACGRRFTVEADRRVHMLACAAARRYRYASSKPEQEMHARPRSTALRTRRRPPSSSSGSREANARKVRSVERRGRSAALAVLRKRGLASASRNRAASSGHDARRERRAASAEPTASRSRLVHSKGRGRPSARTLSNYGKRQTLQLDRSSSSALEDSTSLIPVLADRALPGPFVPARARYPSTAAPRLRQASRVPLEHDHRSRGGTHVPVPIRWQVATGARSAGVMPTADSRSAGRRRPARLQAHTASAAVLHGNSSFEADASRIEPTAMRGTYPATQYAKTWPHHDDSATTLSNMVLSHAAADGIRKQLVFPTPSRQAAGVDGTVRRMLFDRTLDSSDADKPDVGSPPSEPAHNGTETAVGKHRMEDHAAESGVATPAHRRGAGVYAPSTAAKSTGVQRGIEEAALGAISVGKHLTAASPEGPEKEGSFTQDKVSAWAAQVRERAAMIVQYPDTDRDDSFLAVGSGEGGAWTDEDDAQIASGAQAEEIFGGLVDEDDFAMVGRAIYWAVNTGEPTQAARAGGARHVSPPVRTTEAGYDVGWGRALDIA